MTTEAANTIPNTRHRFFRHFICPIIQQYAHLKGKGNPYLITELIPVPGSQPVGDVSHKPDGRLPSLSARPAVTPATLKRAATSFAAW